jgi:hypothetical protein
MNWRIVLICGLIVGLIVLCYLALYLVPAEPEIFWRGDNQCNSTTPSP